MATIQSNSLRALIWKQFIGNHFDVSTQTAAEDFSPSLGIKFDAADAAVDEAMNVFSFRIQAAMNLHLSISQGDKSCAHKIGK